MSKMGFLASGEVDPHPYREAGITRLAVAVLERAMRDAQLVEVGHRVKVCRLDRWNDRDRHNLVTARMWLTDSSDTVFRLWASGAGVNADQLAESVQKRVTWTEQLEAGASPAIEAPTRRQRWPSPSWPFRRVGDDRAIELEENGMSNYAE
jgi:hypothetical protein